MAYFVNDVGDLDPEVVQTCRDHDEAKKRKLLQIGNDFQYDIFLSVHNEWKVFVLVSKKERGEVRDKPFNIPKQLYCFLYELRSEDDILGKYKISRKMRKFKDIETYIQNLFFIGRYEGVPFKALEFAALDAAPEYYETLQRASIRFAEKYCIELLKYSSNSLEIEGKVRKNANEVSESLTNGIELDVMAHENANEVSESLTNGIELDVMAHENANEVSESLTNGIELDVMAHENANEVINTFGDFTITQRISRSRQVDSSGVGNNFSGVDTATHHDGHRVGYRFALLAGGLCVLFAFSLLALFYIFRSII